MMSLLHYFNEKMVLHELERRAKRHGEENSFAEECCLFPKGHSFLWQDDGEDDIGDNDGETHEENRQ